MELCVRFSKNISELNGSGVVLCLLQQVEPDGQADGRQRRPETRESENPIYIRPLPDAADTRASLHREAAPCS